MALTIIRTDLMSTETAIRAAVDKVRKEGIAVRVATVGHPSHTFLVVPEDHRVKLGGFRSVQPRQLAPQLDGVETYRVPLPRRGTVAGSGRQQLIIGTEHQSPIDWKEQGIDWKKAGNTETWSAHRINQLESAVGGGGAAWRSLAKKYAQECATNYDPRTSVLLKHSETMFAVLARIVRDPKRRLGRQRRIVPVVNATEIDTESFAWLVRQSGRTSEEKAHRGVLCSVRTTDYDTLENRVIRDYAQRSISEVQRTEHPHQDLKEWARKCSIVNQDLARLGVGEIKGSIQPNQVLRMNLDYRRVWEARKELLKQAELSELLWCWQGETWNELALCLFKASMAKYSDHSCSKNPNSGWRAIIHSPIRMRRGQREGRWIETDQQSAGIWVNLQRQRVLRLLGGGMKSLGSPTVPACRALMYEMSRDDKHIAEMDVYASPPVDVVNDPSKHQELPPDHQAWHGRIMMVSSGFKMTENVHANKSLCNAMKAIRIGLEKLEQQ